MKYAKYILIFIGLYFDFKYHKEYLNTEKKIQEIESDYKNDLEHKFKEYHLNFEKITFQRDSINLSIDQKYLILMHDTKMQYLKGDLDDKTFSERLHELKKNNSQETLSNTYSWLAKNEKNTWPITPIPELLLDKRKASEGRSNFSFIFSGILLFFFLLLDILTWRKNHRSTQ